MNTSPNTDCEVIAATNNADRAIQINGLHQMIMETARTTLNQAITIGDLLFQAKVAVGHGLWLEWVEKNIQFSEKTCQNYMRCFKARERLKSATVADLDLGEVYKLLADVERKPRPMKDAFDITPSRNQFHDADSKMEAGPPEPPPAPDHPPSEVKPEANECEIAKGTNETVRDYQDGLLSQLISLWNVSSKNTRENFCSHIRRCRCARRL